MPPDGKENSDQPLDRLLKAAASHDQRSDHGGEGGDGSSDASGANPEDAMALEHVSRGFDAATHLEKEDNATAASTSDGSEKAMEYDDTAAGAAELITGAGAAPGGGGGGGGGGGAPSPPPVPHPSSTASRRGVVHTPYGDYSRSPPTPSEKEQLGSVHNPAAPSSLARSQHAKEPTFPLKLHMILARTEWQDIICWLPHGRSFRILNPNAFEDLVLPLYFQHGRYASFARQLNGWNFRRISRGTDFNSYYHELFLRGLPHLCLRMKRLTAKDVAEQKREIAAQQQQQQQQQQLQLEGGPAAGNQPSGRRGDGEPPDFYSMSRDHPLPSPDGDSGGSASPQLQPSAAAATYNTATAAATGTFPTAVSAFVAAQAPKRGALPSMNQVTMPLSQPVSTSHDANHNLMSLLLTLGGNRPVAPAPPVAAPPHTDPASLLALLTQAMNPSSPVSMLLKAFSPAVVAAPPPFAPPNLLGAGLATSGSSSDPLVQALVHALVQANRPAVPVPPPPPPPPQAPQDLQQQLILQLLSSLVSQGSSGSSTATAVAGSTPHIDPVASKAPAPVPVPAPALDVSVRTLPAPLAPSDVLPSHELATSSSTSQQVSSSLLQALFGAATGAASSTSGAPTIGTAVAPAPPKPVAASAPAAPAAVSSAGDPAQLQMLLQLLSAQQKQQQAPPPPKQQQQHPPVQSNTGTDAPSSDLLPANSVPLLERPSAPS